MVVRCSGNSISLHQAYTGVGVASLHPSQHLQGPPGQHRGTWSQKKPEDHPQGEQDDQGNITCGGGGRLSPLSLNPPSSSSDQDTSSGKTPVRFRRRRKCGDKVLPRRVGNSSNPGNNSINPRGNIRLRSCNRSCSSVVYLLSPQAPRKGGLMWRGEGRNRFTVNSYARYPRQDGCGVQR